MKEFKLTDPYGTAPSTAPFKQSVSTGRPWHNLPVTREYTLGQLLDQTVARCGENDAVVYADRDFRLTWYEFGEEVDLLARGLMSLGVKKGEKIALWATNVPHWVVLMSPFPMEMLWRYMMPDSLILSRAVPRVCWRWISRDTAPEA